MEPTPTWPILIRLGIGNAKILNQDTHNDLLSETKMSSYQYTIALMVFLIAYALFEVPSNYFLKKLRPSRWIAFLMLSWGACTMGLGGTHNFSQVTGLRFLLGVMEAGLFPGLVYYLTFWYRHSERSIRVALILASATLAGAFGGAIAYGVGHMNQVHGLSAWRWLFIIEGAPSCASAVLVWFFLPDYPESARWLTEEERDLTAQRLRTEGSKGEAKAMTWEDAKAVLTDWRLYAHYAVYFGISAPFSSLSLFTPAITSGLGYTNLRAQLMTVPPWAVAYVVTTAAAWSADHFNRYKSSPQYHASRHTLTIYHQPWPAFRPLLFHRRHGLPSIRRPPSRRLLTPLRLPHRRHQRRLRLHPPSPGLALLQPPLHSRHGASNSSERVLRRPGPNRRRVDLQSQRSEEGIPDRSLDKCRVTPVCLCGVHHTPMLLRVVEP
jgi:MFS family permease